MARKKNSRTEELSKFEKIRRQPRKSHNKRTAEAPFIIPTTDWESLQKKHDFTARVVEVHKRYAFVCSELSSKEVNSGDIWLAHMARKHINQQRSERNFITVGDRVLCRPGVAGTSPDVCKDLPSCSIECRSPRETRLARTDPLHTEREHVIAANVEQMVIVASLTNPEVKWRFIDRYLVMAERDEIPPIIVLTKKDLLQQQSTDFITTTKKYIDLYRQLGYSVYLLRADQPSSSDKKQIKNIFAKRTSVVTGHSGVGKSSLVNLLQPELPQAVETEELFRKGRHTTSFSSMIRLGEGGYIIDTPGIRALTLPEMDHHELSSCFREFRPLLGQCKYRECHHLTEPECVILNAVHTGDIDPSRYQTYTSLLANKSTREGRVGTVD
ncbi:MAG: ribosome small subunit-dependent GTPase A [Zetaproteobacteria bacterium]|nr:ribosome small subunit-dependent GTPase A [Zetaproteobacteria bacterium]